MAKETNFDIIVIGGGPGGYVAAIRAAQLGMKVACVDKWINAKGKTVFGGTCLNVGCIPSKALLESSYNVVRANEKFKEHGISISGLEFDLSVMQKRKQKIVDALTTGVDGLFKKNKVHAFGGTASFVSGSGKLTVQVTDGAGENTVLEANDVIIATGSVPRSIPSAVIDQRVILDNEGALALTEVPKKLAIVGSGVIGLEMGSIWRRLGSEVVILEALDEFLGSADQDIAKAAKKIFTKEQKLQIQLSSMVTATKVKQNTVEVTWKNGKDGSESSAEFDRLIIAVGRKPYSDGLGLENIGLSVNAQQMIEVDDNCRTKVPHVYAIGDVVRGPMLAHKAEDEGSLVAELIAGQRPHIDYLAIPWVIYTHPEIAWVGKTEQQLRAEGVEVNTGSFPFIANGRARGMGETEGMIKMIADAKTDRILGVHMLGPNVSDMISEAVVAIEFQASSEDIARSCHPHPTLSEVMREAALAVDKRAIHI